MADVSTGIERYRNAAMALDEAIGAINVPMAVDDEGESDEEPDTGTLEPALERYLAESDELFATIVAAHDPDAVAQALGVIEVDLQLAAGALDVAAGPAVTADDTDDAPTRNVAEALDTVEFGRPPAAVLEDGAASVDDVVKAIDDIVDAGTDSLGTVAGSAVIPSSGDVGQVAGALFGAGAGQLVKNTLDQLKGFWKKVARAAAALLGKVVERVGKLFGEERGEQLRKWVEDLVSPGRVIGVVLGVDALKDRARVAVPEKPSRAAVAVAAVDRHAHDLKWIGWGARAVSLAKATAILSTPPWGPVLLGATSLALLAAVVWLTQDHLDAPGLDFLPDRVPGVGAALAS